MPGATTSRVEVTNVSRHGLWILRDGRELFLSFEDFPWFESAVVKAVLNVEEPHPGHLYWPDLDLDLSVESIESPEKFPLVAKSEPER